MCSQAGINFGKKSLTKKEVKGKSVLDVGSRDINGTWRQFVENYQPKEYIGVDFIEGPGVDVVSDAKELLSYFKDKKFDIVITTELLEHAEHWREVIHNIKNVLKPGGILLITTRSIGYGFHGWPHDYWRYEVSDMEKIFSDFKIITLVKDPVKPGVFLKAKKPLNFKERDLKEIKLFSILTGNRTQSINKIESSLPLLWYGGRHWAWELSPKALKKTYISLITKKQATV